MRISTLSTFIFFIFFTSTQNVFADEFKEFYRGARAQGMGNGFVGLADDEEAIFMNPAGVAGYKKMNIHFVDEIIDVSQDVGLTVIKGTQTFSNLSTSTLNSFMGKDLYFRSQFAPTIMLPNFGFGVIVDDQAAVMAKNQALPQITAGFQMTNGFQGAFGFSLTPGNNAVKYGDIRVGVGAKILWRRGGYQLLPITALFTPTTLGSLAGTYGMGEGLDAGLQYLKALNQRMTFGFGIAITDIGDTAFKGSNSVADPIKQDLTMGMALSYKLGKAAVNFVADYKHMTENADWRKRVHTGLGLSLPIVSVYGGISETYLTYGASVDLFLLKITAVSYAEEQGTLSFQDPERRYMLRLSFGLGI